MKGQQHRSGLARASSLATLQSSDVGEPSRDAADDAGLTSVDPSDSVDTQEAAAAVDSESSVVAPGSDAGEVPAIGVEPETVLLGQASTDDGISLPLWQLQVALAALAIAAIGFSLRLGSIHKYWNNADEGIYYQVANAPWAIASSMIAGNAHPPLYYYLLRAVASVFDDFV